MGTTQFYLYHQVLSLVAGNVVDGLVWPNQPGTRCTAGHLFSFLISGKSSSTETPIYAHPARAIPQTSFISSSVSLGTYRGHRQLFPISEETKCIDRNAWLTPAIDNLPGTMACFSLSSTATVGKCLDMAGKIMWH